MGMFGFFKREEVKATPSPKRETKSGAYRENIVRVNGESKAMKLSAVYRAVYLISSGVAALTLQYKRRDRAQGFFKLDDKGEGAVINYLLSVKPNDRMNAFVFLKNLVSQVLLTGNAIVYPDRTGGSIQGYILCSPRTVTYDKDRNTYDIDDDVNKLHLTHVPAGEVIHIKNTCIDGGYWGISTIEYAAITLGIAATSDRETLKRFGTGGRFKAILQDDKTQKGFGYNNEDEMKGMANDIQESLDAGDDIIQVKGDGSLTPISMSSADMQFLESRKFTVREIARFFNVPPSKLMDDSNSNYKSTEMSNIQFYVEAMQPIVSEIQSEFNAKSLSPVTYKDYKFTFDLRNLYALDLESRSKWDKSRMENGQATVNDLRREADREPVEGGDEVYLSTNYAALGSEKLSGKKEGKE